MCHMDESMLTCQRTVCSRWAPGTGSQVKRLRLQAQSVGNQLAFASHDFLQRAKGFTRFGTHGVIRAHVGATNHALLVNDVSCRHRQAIGALAVELVQFVAELRINCFEVIGKFEYEAKLGCDLQPMVRQYIETQIEAATDRTSVPLQLRRDGHEASS